MKTLNLHQLNSEPIDFASIIKNSTNVRSGYVMFCLKVHFLTNPYLSISIISMILLYPPFSFPPTSPLPKKEG